MSEQEKDQQEMIACKKNAKVDYFNILLPKCVRVGVSEHQCLEKRDWKSKQVVSVSKSKTQVFVLCNDILSLITMNDKYICK